MDLDSRTSYCSIKHDPVDTEGLGFEYCCSVYLGETVEELQRSLLLLQCLKEVVDQSILEKAYELFQERV